MKILLSAYACEPNKGSEPEVGWRWATELLKFNNEVYVITRLNNKENIEKEIKKKNLKNLNFIYFDYPRWFLKIFKGKQNKFSYFYFYIWQIAIYFVAKQILNSIKFDYVHHVTFQSFRIPSFLCLLNVPFIFGPVGGGEEAPKALTKDFDMKSKFKEILRNISNNIVKFSPFMNMVFSKSHKILVTSPETKYKIPKKYHHKTFIELGISPDPESLFKKNISKKNYTKFLNICFAGFFEHRKGIIIILEIIKKLKENNHKFLFNFYGKGTEKKYIENFIKKEDLNNYVKFFGNIEREKIYEEFRKNDIFLFPSLRDSGGFVLFEAMSVGLPSIVLNVGGPSCIIDKNCGILINVKEKNQHQVINQIYNELNILIKNKSKLQNLSNNCLLRVKKFSWSNKIKKIYNL